LPIVWRLSFLQFIARARNKNSQFYNYLKKKNEAWIFSSFLARGKFAERKYTRSNKSREKASRNQQIAMFLPSEMDKLQKQGGNAAQTSSRKRNTDLFGRM